MSLGDVRHGEGDLGVSRPPGLPDIAGDADEPAGELRDQRGALMAVAGDQPFHFAISRSRDRKEPKVGAALRKALHQVMQGVASSGRTGLTRTVEPSRRTTSFSEVSAVWIVRLAISLDGEPAAHEQLSLVSFHACTL